MPAIVSNHTDFYQLAASYNITFHHPPLAARALTQAKKVLKARVMKIVETNNIDLVMLVR